MVNNRGRGLNLYSIVNPEAIEENTLTNWALDSFSLGELLLGNSAISDKILLEEIPSGREWLESVLHALQHNIEIEIEYENFVGVKFSGRIKPLCVKPIASGLTILYKFNPLPLRHSIRMPK